MNEATKFKLRKFYIRAFSWEYWPIWLVYFPVSFYYVYLALKARSFFFFSASNPSIETGGMFFESKWSIFKLIPQRYYPATVLIDKADSIDVILAKMKKSAIAFPAIAKPDRGERGWCVKKIHSLEEMAQYKTSMKVDFLVQAYVDYPLELSVFYYRDPTKETGILTSVTLKKLLTVTGDGVSTIDALIRRNDRSFLQYHKIKKNEQLDLQQILTLGEKQVLVPFGNHVLGAMFLDYNHIIDNTLVETFDEISKQIKGFYFGRYDLRCTSIEDLKMGKNIAILELNGAGAEPSHIYDPGFSFFKAQKVIANHYKMMYHAASFNKKAGVPFMSFKSFKNTRRQEKEYKQTVLFA